MPAACRVWKSRVRPHESAYDLAINASPAGVLGERVFGFGDQCRALLIEATTRAADRDLMLAERSSAPRARLRFDPPFCSTSVWTVLQQDARRKQDNYQGQLDPRRARQSGRRLSPLRSENCHNWGLNLT
jgi:hypothetical protein